MNCWTNRAALGAALLFLGMSSAKAQLAWQITHSPHEGNADYSFTALAGKNNWCTAAAVKTDSVSLQLIFLRSNDEGQTWTEQNPNIRAQSSGAGFNKIVQIDSNNIVAIGNNAIIVRSFDAGTTWQKQDLHIPTADGVLDVDFLDSAHGIVCHGSDTSISVTSDGGRNWVPIPFERAGYFQAHLYSTTDYSFFCYGVGPLYVTHNNCQTVDSMQIVDSADLYKNEKLLGYFDWGYRDTILAFGSQHLNVPSPPRPFIARTSDGGITWKDTTISNTLNSILNFTSLEHDTIVAGGLGFGRVLISTDAGFSWRSDTIIIPTHDEIRISDGLYMTGDGHVIGAFDVAPGAPGYLLRGTIEKAAVRTTQVAGVDAQIFPNPSTSDINIKISNINEGLSLYDDVGREVMKTRLINGQAKVNVSTLDPGVYSLRLDQIGVVAGRIVVVAK